MIRVLAAIFAVIGMLATAVLIGTLLGYLLIAAAVLVFLGMLATGRFGVGRRSEAGARGGPGSSGPGDPGYGGSVAVGEDDA